MAYTSPTLAQAQAALAARLYDPSNVYWTAAELTVYLRESLRWWNAATSHFRESASFPLTMAQAIFDLPTVLPTLRAQSVTNWDLVTDLQYALLEPPAAGGTWTGTDQFDLTVLSTAIQRRRDQFLRETGAVLSSLATVFVANATGRFELAENVLIVRTADWIPNATLLRLPLLKTDEWAANTFAPAWPSGAIGSITSVPPIAYSVSVTPPLFIQVIPPPATDGVLDAVTINAGAAINPVINLSLGVPDDWAWVIKFGALADLLQQDGLALDAQRADYCEQRWRQGIDQAKKASVVLTARINGSTIRLASLADATTFTPLWQLLTGPPQTLLTAGHTLIACSPPAGGGGPYTALLDVVRNAPVPAAGGDILQISQDVYDSILDYAQHLALFKQGAGQLQLATALLVRAATAAGVDLRLQQASQPSRVPLLSQSLQDEHVEPREEEAIPVS